MLNQYRVSAPAVATAPQLQLNAFGNISLGGDTPAPASHPILAVGPGGAGALEAPAMPAAPPAFAAHDGPMTAFPSGFQALVQAQVPAGLPEAFPGLGAQTAPAPAPAAAPAVALPAPVAPAVAAPAPVAAAPAASSAVAFPGSMAPVQGGVVAPAAPTLGGSVVGGAAAIPTASQVKRPPLN